jgi:hypothetical protein
VKRGKGRDRGIMENMKNKNTLSLLFYILKNLKKGKREI